VTRTVLLVEDDREILDMMDLLLRRLGYNPVLVEDVDEAIGIVRNRPPDLILLDVMMTPVNGWEFLDILRNRLGMKDLPVLLFTASPSVDEKAEDLHDPMLGILRKPVSLAQLDTGIKKFLGE
jgi:CheY-like chemotaxis protein